MTSVRRRAVTRLAAAVLAPGLLAAGAIAGAASAAADDQADQPGGGATATLDGLKTYDQAVIHTPEGDKKTGAGLFEMTVDGGGTLQTYCIDIAHPTTDKARYGEVSWSESSLNDNQNAGKILWILQNSYPQVNDLNKLAEAAKFGDGEKLSPKTAAAGTQVAIWRFSDKADVEAVDPAAEKLADHLEQAAQNVPEPTASLKLDPQSVSGKAGERLGPVTVDTNAQSVTVGTPAGAGASGVQVVDKDGNKITSTTDGGELYFDVPEGTEPGTASVTAQASTKVPVGRAFTSLAGHKSQTQILAGSSESTVSATATAAWTDEGPVPPAVTAEKDCAAGGVTVTVTNKGTEPLDFSLAGEKKTVAAKGSEEVTVPVDEDQRYKITVTGADGFEKTFTGILDCETAGTGGGDEGTTPQTGGDTPGDDEAKGGDDADLAATGSSSNTPLIVGLALGLVAAGGAAMVIVRKRRPSTASPSSSAGSDD